MRYWDVFHTSRLEAERSLTTEAVREAIARGNLLPDDLVRPVGETAWTRITEAPEFTSAPASTLAAEQAETPPPIEPDTFAPPSFEAEFDVIVEHPEHRGQSEFEIDPDAFASIDRDELRRAEADAEVEDEDEDEDEDDSEEAFEFIPEHDPEPERTIADRPPSNVFGNAIVLDDIQPQRNDVPEYDDPIPDLDFEELDPADEDDEAAGFTLSRSKAETVEELDLAAMVDVAFQLVLFFLVTAQVVLFKTLEIPKPNEDKPPDAAVQARAKSVDELEKDYILVEVDAAGIIKIDRQPVPALRAVLIEKLRKTREDTQRKAMLLSADFATRHEHAVLVFDVANEIDLKIAIAQPAAKK
jgi:biopolymer transport protein ExbD